MGRLYRTYKTSWDLMEARGFPRLVEMTKCFDGINEFSLALGYSKTAAVKWAGGKNGATRSAELRAHNWLAKRKMIATQPAPTPATVQKTSSDLLLVRCPIGEAEKAKRVLSMLGCEVESL